MDSFNNHAQNNQEHVRKPFVWIFHSSWYKWRSKIVLSVWNGNEIHLFPKKGYQMLVKDIQPPFCRIFNNFSCTPCDRPSLNWPDLFPDGYGKIHFLLARNLASDPAPNWLVLFVLQKFFLGKTRICPQNRSTYPKFQ